MDELAQEFDVALFVVEGSLPGLLVKPAGDRGLDEAAQFGGVECFDPPLRRGVTVQAVADDERGPARIAEPCPLMALSGHRNLRTLGIYVQPSTEAAALAEHDPGRRHH